MFIGDFENPPLEPGRSRLQAISTAPPNVSDDKGKGSSSRKINRLARRLKSPRYRQMKFNTAVVYDALQSDIYEQGHLTKTN